MQVSPDVEAAFLNQERIILTQIEKLKEAANDHFDSAFQSITWESVGVLRGYTKTLAKLLETISGTQETEY